MAVHPASGAVYVTDLNNHRLRAFDTAYAFNVADPDNLRRLAVDLPEGSVQDATGNPNVAPRTAGVYVDRTAPAPAVSTEQRGPTNATVIEFQLDFEGAINATTFVTSDINATTERCKTWAWCGGPPGT